MFVTPTYKCQNYSSDQKEKGAETAASQPTPQVPFVYFGHGLQAQLLNTLIQQEIIDSDLLLKDPSIVVRIRNFLVNSLPQSFAQEVFIYVPHYKKRISLQTLLDRIIFLSKEDPFFKDIEIEQISICKEGVVDLLFLCCPDMMRDLFTQLNAAEFFHAFISRLHEKQVSPFQINIELKNLEQDDPADSLCLGRVSFLLAQALARDEQESNTEKAILYNAIFGQRKEIGTSLEIPLKGSPLSCVFSIGNSYPTHYTSGHCFFQLYSKGNWTFSLPPCSPCSFVQGLLYLLLGVDKLEPLEDVTTLSCFDYVAQLSRGIHVSGNRSQLLSLFSSVRLEDMKQWVASMEGLNAIERCARLINASILMLHHASETKASTLLSLAFESSTWLQMVLPENPSYLLLRLVQEKKHSLKTLLSCLQLSAFLHAARTSIASQLIEIRSHDEEAPSLIMHLDENAEATLQMPLTPHSALHYLLANGEAWSSEEERDLLPLLFPFFPAPLFFEHQEFFEKEHETLKINRQYLKQESEALLTSTSSLLNLLGLHLFACFFPYEQKAFQFHLLRLMPTLCFLLPERERVLFLNQARPYLGKHFDTTFHQLPLEEFQKKWVLALARCGHTEAVVDCCKRQIFQPDFYLEILQIILTHSPADTERLFVFLKKRSILKKMDRSSLYTLFVKMLSEIKKTALQDQDFLLIFIAKEISHLQASQKDPQNYNEMYRWLTQEMIRCNRPLLAYDLLARASADGILDDQSREYIGLWLSALAIELAHGGALEELDSRLTKFVNVKNRMAVIKKLPKLRERFEKIKQQILAKQTEEKEDLQSFSILISKRTNPEELERIFLKLLSAFLQSGDAAKAKQLFEKAWRSNSVSNEVLFSALHDLIMHNQKTLDQELFSYLLDLLLLPSLWNDTAIKLINKCLNQLSLNLSKENKLAIIKIMPFLFEALRKCQSDQAVGCALALHTHAIPIEASEAHANFWLWMLNHGLKAVPPNLHHLASLLKIAKVSHLPSFAPEEYARVELAIATQWVCSLDPSYGDEEGVGFVENLIHNPHLLPFDKQSLIKLIWLTLEYLRNKDSKRAIQFLEKIYTFDHELLPDILPHFEEILEIVSKEHPEAIYPLLKNSTILQLRENQTLPGIISCLQKAAERTMQIATQQQIRADRARKRLEQLLEIMTICPLAFSTTHWKQLLETLHAKAPALLPDAWNIIKLHHFFEDQPVEYYKLIELTVKGLATLNDPKKNAYILSLLDLKPIRPIEEDLFPDYLDAFYLLVREGLNSFNAIDKKEIEAEKVLKSLASHVRTLQKKCRMYIQEKTYDESKEVLRRKLPLYQQNGCLIFFAHFPDEQENLPAELEDRILEGFVAVTPFAKTHDRIDILCLQLVREIALLQGNNPWKAKCIRRHVHIFANSWHTEEIWKKAAVLFNILLKFDDEKARSALSDLISILDQIEIKEIDHYELILFLLSVDNIKLAVRLFYRAYSSNVVIDKTFTSLFSSLVDAMQESNSGSSYAEKLALLDFLNKCLPPSSQSTSCAEARMHYYLCAFRIFEGSVRKSNRERILNNLKSCIHDLPSLRNIQEFDSLIEAINFQIIDLASLKNESATSMIEQSSYFFNFLKQLKIPKLEAEMKYAFLNTYIEQLLESEEIEASEDLFIWGCFLARQVFLGHPDHKTEKNALVKRFQRAASNCKQPEGLTAILQGMQKPKDKFPYFDMLLREDLISILVDRKTLPAFFEKLQIYLSKSPPLFIHFYLRFLSHYSKKPPQDFLKQIAEFDSYNHLIFKNLNLESLIKNKQTQNILVRMLGRKLVLGFERLRQCESKGLTIDPLIVSLYHNLSFCMQSDIYLSHPITLLSMAYPCIPYLAKMHASGQHPKNYETSTVYKLFVQFYSQVFESHRGRISPEDPTHSYVLACTILWSNKINASDLVLLQMKYLDTEEKKKRYVKTLRILNNQNILNLF